MKLKTSCDNCLHNEVCGYKELMHEIEEKIEDSGALTVHPFVNVELNCVKWITSEYARNAETSLMIKKQTVVAPVQQKGADMEGD